METKYCKPCQRVLPLDSFTSDHRCCLVCNRQRRAEYRARKAGFTSVAEYTASLAKPRQSKTEKIELLSQGSRRCPVCQIVHPLPAFSSDAANQCRSCTTAIWTAYRSKNSDQLRASRQASDLRRAEKRRQDRRARYWANREKGRADQARYREANRDAIALKQRQQRAELPDNYLIHQFCYGLPIDKTLISKEQLEIYRLHLRINHELKKASK